MLTRTPELWNLLRGETDALSSLTLSGHAILPSRFHVTGLALDAVAMASLAVAELMAARHRAREAIPSVRVSSVEAAAAFRCEALLRPSGWQLPPVWDPVAGDYRAKDRWIRLHTNYPYHRRAALGVLGANADRVAVEAAVAKWEASALEAAIVAAGGCAAAMHSQVEWLATPHGIATRNAPPIHVDLVGAAATPLPAPSDGPLSGIKILDLTRVIAGPLCTRFLAAYGATVLRIDPPGFEEVPALLPETTLGKRCASLALDTDEGRARFAALIEEADVIVHGLRPGALEGVGFGEERLRDRNPSLVIAMLDAYGWEGPWRDRRGFDSLVQMSRGIACPPSTSSDKPQPLPAQALDHGAGYLLAAGVCRALTMRVREQRTSTIRASLLGVAHHLLDRGDADDAHLTAPAWPEHVFEARDTVWGPSRAVRVPGTIEGARPAWAVRAGALGRHRATFDADRSAV